MENKPNYYAIIPAEVRYDNELPANAKLLYGEITALCNKHGCCFATNDYFAKLYNVSKSSVSKWISLLVDKGYVDNEIIYKEGSKEILNRYVKILPYPIVKKLKDNNTSNNKYNNNNYYNNITKYDNNNYKHYNNDLSTKDSIITNINNIYNIYIYIEQNFSITINGTNYEKIEEWLKVYDDEILCYAIDKCVANNVRTLSYFFKILENWKGNNYKTMQQIREGELKREDKSKTKSKEQEEFEELMSHRRFF